MFCIVFLKLSSSLFVGLSCSVVFLQVPNYSPRDVIENLKRRIDGKSFVEMQPWYNGFAGSIEVRLVVSFASYGRSLRGNASFQFTWRQE